ncbi:MAG: hypothetical protein AAB581_02115 [Patescibacteria group bacterium]
MNEILISLRLLFDAVMCGIADFTQATLRVSGVGRTEAQVYLRGLRNITLIGILAPVILVLLGITSGLWPFTAIAGIILALGVLILALYATPIGLVLDALLIIRADGAFKAITGGYKHIGTRYVTFVLWVLLTELCATAFVTVVPLKNNPQVIPAVIVLAGILGVLALLGTTGVFGKKFVAGIASLLLIVFTLSFFFPNRFHQLEEVRQAVDMGTPLPGQQQAQAVQMPPYVTTSNYYVGSANAVLQPHNDIPNEVTTRSDGTTLYVTKCDRDEEITVLKPGETIQIVHQPFGELSRKANRCSYNFFGHAYFINGDPDVKSGAGMEGDKTLPEVVESLPFPDIPAGALVFYVAPPDIERPYKHAVMHDYIRQRVGGKLLVRSRWETDMKVYAIPNYPMIYFVDKDKKIQLGWDGSRSTFFVEPLPVPS